MNLKKGNSLRARICVLALVTILGTSCTYDSREDAGPFPCDTTAISFSFTIRPILNSNCIVCHSAADPAGNLNFETYAGVQESVTTGRLIGALKHLDGFKPMPEFAPMLPDCEILKIEKWVNDGTPNN